MTNAVLFSESYYRQVLAEFNYTPFDLRQFDFSVAGLDADTLNTRYLCHHHGEQYLSAAPQRRSCQTRPTALRPYLRRTGRAIGPGALRG